MKDKPRGRAPKCLICKKNDGILIRRWNGKYEYSRYCQECRDKAKLQGDGRPKARQGQKFLEVHNRGD